VSVYIELVIFNNFFLDLMLLYATLSVRRRKLNALRAIFSALFGAICATAYPIIPTEAQICIKLLLAPIMCIAAATPQGKNAKLKIGDFIGTTLIFVLLTYFSGGVVFGLSYAIGVDLKSYAVLGLMSIAVIALIMCAKLIAHKRSSGTSATCKTVVRAGGREVSVEALCDSGNLLVDDVSGLPIVILSQELEDKLNARKLTGFINVNTVSGEDSLALVSIDKISVNGRHFKALGALSHKHFDTFDIILQNSMF